ncbi:MAG: hypothetical protein WCW16_05470 [Candidatus Magasanikbacteria bacterium]
MKMLLKKHVWYFLLACILWFGSYAAITYSGLGAAYFHTDRNSIFKLLGIGLPIFVLPIIPLIAIFYLGEQLMKRKYLLLFTLGLFILLLLSPTISLYNALQYRGEGMGGAFIVASVELYLIEYLLIQFGFALLFFLFRRFFSAWKFSTVILVSLLIFLLSGTLFISRSWTRSLSFEQNFCTEHEANGFYSRLFFLEPLSKHEIQKLIQENDLTIRFMVIAKKENKGDYFTLNFNSLFYSSFGKDTANEPLAELLKPILTSVGGSEAAVQDKYEEEMKKYAPLLQAYENNEPVVWFIDLEKYPMTEMVALANKLDKQGQLGVYAEKSLQSYGGYNPEKIIPQTSELKISQERCYKYIE